MRALIFAAGKGERMRPLSLHTPKPLLNVGGKPLIVWQIEKLAAIGVGDIVINTSWLAAQFPAVLGDGSDFGVHLHYCFEGAEPLETGGGLLHALPQLGPAPFIVVNGDIWSDYDFARLPEQPSGLAHLVLVALPESRPLGAFERAVSALLPASADAEPAAPWYTLAGISVVRPELLDGHRPGTFPLAPLLTAAAREGLVSVERLTGVWHDVGTPERWRALNAELAAGRSVQGA